MACLARAGEDDFRGIERPIAIQIVKTLGRYGLSGDGATQQPEGVTAPLIRLHAQNHRVSDRKEAHR